MHCNKCNSDWNTDKFVSTCPFCGASLTNEGRDEPNIYDNSKDALAHIMRVHGAEVLLGSTLKNYFTDYAPGVEVVRKNVVFFVVTSGAADILKNKMTASAGEQENVFRQAVQKVVDTYGTERSLVESVVLEFTDALGWKVNIQTQHETSQNKPVQPKPLQGRQTPPERPQRYQMQQATKTAENLTVGQRNVRFGKYNWRVLDVQNGKALLLTEDVIEERRYHSSMKAITWEGCELRGYLNGAFLQTFSSSEQSRIASVANTNPDNPWYGTPGGKNTADKVFLLSIDEVVKYFGDSGQLRKRLEDRYRYCINDQYNEARMAKYRNKGVWWWLRSPGRLGNDAATVPSDGCLNISGHVVYYIFVGGGVRPALWLNL